MTADRNAAVRRRLAELSPPERARADRLAVYAAAVADALGLAQAEALDLRDEAWTLPLTGAAKHPLVKAAEEFERRLFVEGAVFEKVLQSLDESPISDALRKVAPLIQPLVAT